MSLLLWGSVATTIRQREEQEVHFHAELPDVSDLQHWFGPTKGGVLVLDDLMEEAGNDKCVLDLLTKNLIIGA